MQETISAISKRRPRSWAGITSGLLCLVLIGAPSAASADDVGMALEALEAKLDAVEAKLDGMTIALDDQSTKLDAIEAKLDGLSAVSASALTPKGIFAMVAVLLGVSLLTLRRRADQDE